MAKLPSCRGITHHKCHPFFSVSQKGEATGSFERVVLVGIPSFPRPEDAEDLGAYLVMRGIQFIDLNNFFLSSF